MTSDRTGMEPGIITKLLNNITPSMNIMNEAVAKFLSPSKLKSTTGSLCFSSQMTTTTRVISTAPLSPAAKRRLRNRARGSTAPFGTSCALGCHE